MLDQNGQPANNVNKSVGFGLDSENDSSTTKSGINTENITITNEIAQQAVTGKIAEQMKQDILTDVTTDTARENSGALVNNFDKDKVQSEINLQMDVTKQFDENRQEAGLTVENIGHAIQTGVNAYSEVSRVTKGLNEIYESLEDPVEQQLFIELMQAVVQDNQVKEESSAVPVVVAGGAAAYTCVRNPTGCAKLIEKTGTALIALGIQVGILNNDDKKSESTPKPLPSTSGNSATGMPPNGEDENNVGVREPNSRHNSQSVTQSSRVKENNTVVTRSVNMKEDTIIIRNGQAQNIGRDPKTGDLLHKLPNGRVYAQKNDGQLYPHSGPGIHGLDRGGYNALGVYNKFGKTDRAESILKSMGITPQARSAALKVLQENAK